MTLGWQQVISGLLQPGRWATSTCITPHWWLSRASSLQILSAQHAWLSDQIAVEAWMQILVARCPEESTWPVALLGGVFAGRGLQHRNPRMPPHPANAHASCIVQSEAEMPPATAAVGQGAGHDRDRSALRLVSVTFCAVLVGEARGAHGLGG